jgi:hypothetical protein
MGNHGFETNRGFPMNAKILLSAVLFALAFAAVHPVLARPKVANAFEKQNVVKQPVGLPPSRGDVHVYLKAF